MGNGATLQSGASLRSPDDRYALIMQADGNLVEYGPAGVIWHTRTGSAGSVAIMQGDGNLVIYRPGGVAVWHSQTGGTGPYSSLVLQNDGNLVIYSLGNGPVWSSYGGATGRSGNALGPGQSLGVGDTIHSPDGRYRLVMQGDGNLVQYGPAGVVWATYTGSAGSVAIMQSDGNLVIYRPGGVAVWHSQTGGRGASRLALQSDSNLVIYGPSGPTWTRGSGAIGQPGTRGRTRTSNGGYAGNCTWWVYERARDAIGVYPDIGGNAWQMALNAPGKGWTVTSQSRAQSILAMPPGSGASSVGHVMWVKQVDGNRVLISDMNYDNRGGIRDNVWYTPKSTDRFILIN